MSCEQLDSTTEHLRGVIDSVTCLQRAKVRADDGLRPDGLSRSNFQGPREENKGRGTPGNESREEEFFSVELLVARRPEQKDRACLQRGSRVVFRF